jgi:hypothetical protein
VSDDGRDLRDRLLETATEAASGLWPECVAVVRPRLIADAVEFVADQLHANGPASRKETVAHLAGAGPAGSLLDTDLGRELDRQRSFQWMWWVVEELVSRPAAAPVVEWAARTAGRDPGWPVASLHPIIDEFGAALGLDEAAQAMRRSVLDEVGRYPVGRIIELDDGRATERQEFADVRNAADGAADALHRAEYRRFYEDNRGDFERLTGIRDRRLEAGDLLVVLAAANELGWGLRERVMYRKGAPMDAFSLQLAARFTSSTTSP